MSTTVHANAQVNELYANIKEVLTKYVSTNTKLDAPDAVRYMIKANQTPHSQKWTATAAFLPVEIGRIKEVAVLEVVTEKRDDEARVEALEKLLEAVEEELESAKHAAKEGG